MIPATATPHRTQKQQGYTLSTKLPVFWIPPKITKKKSAEFSSAMLHEIRNPLTCINLAMEALKEMMKDDAHVLYLDIIRRGSDRINELVSDMLVPSATNSIQPSRNSIHQLLDEVLTMAKDRLNLKNIRVSKVYDKDDRKIVVNKERLKIALTNIIINAIDAMPSANGQLKLITKSENGRYIVKIEDNGIGISKENLGTIFKPYITNKPGGMGLGLSTTLDILLSNHIKVDVQSEEGKGTQFTLFFSR